MAGAGGTSYSITRDACVLSEGAWLKRDELS